ncbi:MAG: hypothetical protein K2K83_06100, partial [Rikenella sp.]|nr:hypothetical protein [Rikenella sp.]
GSNPARRNTSREPIPTFRSPSESPAPAWPPSGSFWRNSKAEARTRGRSGKLYCWSCSAVREVVPVRRFGATPDDPPPRSPENSLSGGSTGPGNRKIPSANCRSSPPSPLIRPDRPNGFRWPPRKSAPRWPRSASSPNETCTTATDVDTRPVGSSPARSV